MGQNSALVGEKNAGPAGADAGAGCDAAAEERLTADLLERLLQAATPED